MDNLPDGVAALTPAVREWLSHRLALDHRREIAELSGLDADAALALSHAVSVAAYAVHDRAGTPLFAFGVEAAGALTACAQVWMVGTERMAAHPRRVMACTRWGLARAFAVTGAACLEQYIPAWYATGLRFVRRHGFRAEPARFPPGPGLVYRVVLEKEEYQASRMNEEAQQKDERRSAWAYRQ